jgi:formylglycine-generating enzyme required for sulfatase activity
MGQNWAIVVGINEYSNLQRLNYAERDAASVRDLFGELGFKQVYFFAQDAPRIAGDSGPTFSADPTFGEFDNFLDRRFEKAFLKPSDNLWFFFAGHGRREAQQDYLMLRDSNPRKVEGSALKIQYLAAVLQNSGAGNVILLLDACRNDGSRGGLGIGGTPPPPGVITFYACAPNQQSYEIDELRSGAFTHILLEELRLRAEDGNCVTVEWLAQHLRVNVPELVKRHKGMAQDPVLALDPDSKRHAILLPQNPVLALDPDSKRDTILLPKNLVLALDPDSKRDAILLPQNPVLARSKDVKALKVQALNAEARGDRTVAEQIWIQVLAASPADTEAIQGIKRLATISEKRNQESRAERTTSDNRSTTARSATPAKPVTPVRPVDASARPVFTRQSRVERTISDNQSTTARLATPAPERPVPPRRSVASAGAVFTRRRMIQWLGWGGAGLAGAGIIKAGIDGQNQQPILRPTQPVRPIASEIPTPSPKPSPSETIKPEPKETQASRSVKFENFQFETVQLDDTGKEVNREKLTRKRFNQKIAGDISLPMVQIPAGNFIMGSPESEGGHESDESPQREVSVAEFFMAQTPITQAQWRSVAKLKKVNIDLNADPSNFKGDRRPVEQVSWWEAQEFCDRLSKFTGLSYRLPSEAEWEYACRAGTKTPFYFGETLTTEVANYRGVDRDYQGKTYPGNYGNGPKGKFLERTTDVMSYFANAWGLYDMHGNVWEWCADHWHDNYQNAPIEGSAWLTDKKDATRVLRGGSWVIIPVGCRCANRDHNVPTARDYYAGFRVMCLRSA